MVKKYMIKSFLNHNYRFYRNKKELLNNEPYYCSVSWNHARRRNILHEDDGYYYLIYDYLMAIKSSLNDLLPMAELTQFYSVERDVFNTKWYHRYLLFTVKLPKDDVSDSFFESISELKMKDWNTTFILSDAMIEGNTPKSVGTLKLLYYESYRNEIGYDNWKRIWEIRQMVKN